MAGAVIRITKGKMFQETDAILATPPPGKTLAQWYQQLRQDLVDAQDNMAAMASEVGAPGRPAEGQQQHRHTHQISQAFHCSLPARACVWFITE
jgi:hypothetical protein